jgi:hypothetical protein
MMPSVAIVQVECGHWRMPRLWLPLFLLWIPGLLLAPLAVLAGLVCCVAGGVQAWRAAAAFWRVICALPGTHIRVETHETRVRVQLL